MRIHWKSAAALAIALATSMLPLQADAHTQYSSWYGPGPGGSIITHPSPFHTGTIYVGYLNNGVQNGTTNGYARSSGTYRLVAINRCSRGQQTSSGLITVNAPNQRVSAPLCSTYGYGTLSQGQLGVASTNSHP